MNEQRKDEIGRKFIFSPQVSAEEYEALEIQELIFLIHSAKYFKVEEVFPNVYLDERIKEFHNVLLEKIKEAETLYIAYEKNTNYPYLDADDRVWIFSREAYAANARDYFMQQLLMLDMQKVDQENILPKIAELHTLGLPRILLDNGQYHVEIERDELLPPPDWSGVPEINIPVSNPGLQRALIRFFQTMSIQDPDQDRKRSLLQTLETEMLEQLIQARYLLPMQLIEPNPSPPDEHGKKTIGAGATLQFGVLGGEGDTIWLPAFTDWAEFEKVYDKEIWSSNVAGYEDLLALSETMSGIVINCQGIPLRIDEKNKRMIEAYRSERSS
ncbi:MULTISPECIES: SseB family protein [Paenibacillus]|uniref:SseB family protein n=1 Tax=Paenibacillus TaxID=44249 RepID=UPI002FE3AC05